MDFSNFSYTKKDGEKKDYFVLKMEEDDKYFEGIVLSKLEESEIEDLIGKYFKLEVKNKEIEKFANDSNKTTEEYLLENQEAKEELDSYYNLVKPYIKKAYRKFIKSNIENPVLSDNGTKDLMETVSADLSDNKK